MRLLKIGRDASCDIVMHSDRVSSLHAELTLLNSGDIMLEDKGSRNGTFIMNQQIKPNKPVNVKRGDAIRFADVELQWSQVPMPEDNSAYKGVYGIGSHFNNDFQISGSTVSRYHATVKQGRDGKMYLFDHSKNGTTVDGSKIPSNSPYRIKKSSAVVCGGVPVDLSRLPWPSEAWKYILGIAASVLILAGVGFGVWKFWPDGNKHYTDAELYERYNHSIVMLLGIYHYDVSVGDWGEDEFVLYNKYCAYIAENYNQVLYIPPQVQIDPVSGDFVLSMGQTSKELIEKYDKKGHYGGTGFFISQDGQLLTNLHVVKPWIDINTGTPVIAELLQDEFSKRLAKFVDFQNNLKLAQKGLDGALFSPSYLSAYISKIKVTGVLDYVALIPHGEVYDPDNIIKCRVLSAGEDAKKDVALVQTINKRLPTGDCTIVNIEDSIDVSDDALSVGEHIYTLGFPMLTSLQDLKAESGIQLLARGGSITQLLNEYQFGFDAASFGGASGSPIFNERGMLIGILNAGATNTQGFNYGIKAKYIKELVDNPHNNK